MTLLAIITEIIDRKEAAGIAPLQALFYGDLIKIMPDERERIEKELKVLEAAGMIRTGNTINDRYIKIK